jgi:urease accessory protein UreF
MKKNWSQEQIFALLRETEAGQTSITELCRIAFRFSARAEARGRRSSATRFTRKSLAFSNSLFMHLLALQHFFLRCNQEQAQKYNLSFLT